MRHQAVFLMMLDEIAPYDLRVARLIRDGWSKHLDRALLFLGAQLRQKGERMVSTQSDRN